MKYFLLCIFTLMSFHLSSQEMKETDEIYWETPKYLSKLENTAAKVKYVYHYRSPNFIGDWIVPLNMMPSMEGYAEIYKQAISKYHGREHLLTKVIPTLERCLWNDVVFLSPVHPHKQYEELKRIGFHCPKKFKFFKIPIDVLKEKRITVFKWLSYKKYPKSDPIHESLESYCNFDFFHYQELEDLPEDTKEFYLNSFDSEKPEQRPKLFWYRVPHILCQDPIDVRDERITIINWEDPIDE